jgi:hypothetical protein
MEDAAAAHLCIWRHVHVSVWAKRVHVACETLRYLERFGPMHNPTYTQAKIAVSAWHELEAAVFKNEVSARPATFRCRCSCTP